MKRGRILCSSALLAVLLTTGLGAKADDLKVVVFADSQGPNSTTFIHDVFDDILTRADAHQPDAWFVPGDLVYGFSSTIGPQYTEWKARVAANVTCGHVYVGPGNHDIYRTGNEQDFRDAFVAAGHVVTGANSGPSAPGDPHYEYTNEQGLTYFVDIGNTRFVMLDTDRINDDVRASSSDFRYHTANAGWLENVALANTPQGVEHIYVLGHEPGYSSTVGANDPNYNYHWGDLGYPGNMTPATPLGNNGQLFDIMDAAGVEAYFCGHHHAYIRQYLDTPGGGNHTMWQVHIGTAGGPLQTPYPMDSPPQDLPGRLAHWEQRYGYGLLTIPEGGAPATFTFYGITGGTDGSYEWSLLDTFTIPEPTAVALFAPGVALVFRRHRRPRRPRRPADSAR